MELPSANYLLARESRAYVEISPNDKKPYPWYYEQFCFSQLLELAKSLAPTKRGKAQPGSDFYALNVRNWDEVYKGYDEWAAPVDIDYDGEEMASMKIKVKRLFAAPIVRKLRDFTNSEEFHVLGKKVYVLFIELNSICASSKKDKYDKIEDKSAFRVWRLCTCFGDTNLDGFHDQIINPAMGWRRHYHSYKFIVPTSGATFGPEDSDAVDAWVWAGSNGSYFLNSEDYDLRHVMRKPGHRLGYTYDLGDWWQHNITVVDIVDRGTEVNVGSWLKNAGIEMHSDNQTSWTVAGNELIAGDINCPPEDSRGCNEVGRYESLLEKGKKYVPTEIGINWKEHGIRRAFDFDLKAHQRRFNKATSHKKNPVEGAKTCEISIMCRDDDSDFGSEYRKDSLEAKGLKSKTTGVEFEREYVGKKVTNSKCACCGKIKGTNTGLNLSSCGRCKAVKYCGRDCQRAHWKIHKKNCKPVEPIK